MSVRLHSAGEIAALLGVTRHWVMEHASREGSPLPSYHVTRGEGTQHLWTTHDLDRWRAYHAGADSLPRRATAADYSDHQAVNKVANTIVTWKLWWQITSDGPVWWFSTPGGWWTSSDDGRSWRDTGMLVKPAGYRYQGVNGNVMPNGSMSGMLRSVAALRRRLEAS